MKSPLRFGAVDLTLSTWFHRLGAIDLVPSIWFQNGLYSRDPGERKKMEPNRLVVPVYFGFHYQHVSPSKLLIKDKAAAAILEVAAGPV
ncbi:hypothetical protein F2Q68_00036258 [Brassica cretica]|uniref:Uncharacterized protein n=1 Tax=Brassica cretica TaxID=69181 RepID=A0A8S9H5L4_BRACR|nr:hypothetical protein F2Q68_00036258 [Brassica cretica]